MDKTGFAVYLAIALVTPGCGDDGGGGGGSSDAATIDSSSSDGLSSDAATDAAGPVNASCSALPLTLHRTFNAGFRYDYGVICYNPPGGPDPADCQIKEGLFQTPSAAGCSFGGVMIGEFITGAGVVGGVIDFFFGTTTVDSASPGNLNGTNVNGIPDAAFTADFRSNFNTATLSTADHRVALTYNADDTVTVTAMAVVP
jgi:hypothetical protein